jgi:hypothetical protein
MPPSNQPKTPDFTQEIMTQISTGQVKMRSKLCFAIGSIGLGMAISVIASLGALIISLILFSLKLAAPLEYLRFGPQGIRPFFANLPLVFMVLAALAIVLVIFLLKKYDFSYRHNLWGLVLGVIALILTTGVIFDRVGAQQHLMRRSMLRPLLLQPSAGENWLTGKILTQKGPVWRISTLDEKVVKLNIESASLPRRPMNPGEVIRAVGEWQQEVFKAEAVFGSGRPRHWPEGMRKRSHPQSLQEF